MNKFKTSAFGLVVFLVAGGASADPIMVEDARGNAVTLERPASALATIPIPSASITMALNGGPNIVAAMHPVSKSAIEGGVLGQIFPTAAQIPTDITAGGLFNPNVETLLRYKPDLVVQWASRGDDIIKPLENAGLTVFAINYGQQSDSEEIITKLGTLTGKEDRAQGILKWHRDTKAAIEAQSAAIPDAEKPRVMYFLRFADSFRPSGSGTYNDFYIGLAGGKNATDLNGLSTNINAEQIVAWQPDVILLGNFDKATPADVYANPLFADLPAVKNKRVYKVPLGGYRWDPPSHESPLMWMWLAEMLHPTRFDFDLKVEMRRFFQEVYGYRLSDKDIAGILQTDLNRDAAAYDQLVSR